MMMMTVMPILRLAGHSAAAAAADDDDGGWP